MYLINKDETEHTGQVRDSFRICDLASSHFSFSEMLYILDLISDQSQDSKGRLQKLQ